MKKKLLVILMSLALAITMMPLSVFATDENEEVVTPIGNTGLSLVSDHEAVPSAGETEKTGDYYIGNDYVNIDTNGWKLIGSSDYEVYFTPVGKDLTIEFGDLRIPYFNIEHDDTSTTLTISGNVNIFSNNDSFAIELFGDLKIIGNGSLNVDNGMIASTSETEGNFISFDLPRVNVNSSTLYLEHVSCGIIAPKVEILSGQVISRSTATLPDPSVTSAGIVSETDDLVISEDAEVFASGNSCSIAWPEKETINPDEYLGNAENISYDLKSEVNSPVEIGDFTIGSVDFSTFDIAGTDATKALTAYHPSAHPEPEMFDVTFKYQDGVTEDLVKQVADGGLIEQPVDPVREGYTFEGWYDNSECEGNPYDFSTPVHTSFTLYAKWVENQPSPTPDDPTNPDNPGTGGGASTGDSAMPILFITLGFVAAVIGFIAYRKIKSR